MGITVSDGPIYEMVGEIQEGDFFYFAIRPNHPRMIVEALQDLKYRINKQEREIKSFYIRNRANDSNISEIYLHTETISS